MANKKSAGAGPIGLFDSGVGGLTVAHALHTLLPSEQLIYFGDTAHLPYGDKSRESIVHYSLGISDFLLEQKCKIILIACNSASSNAYDEVKEHVGDRALVMNVIDPVVNHVCVNASSILNSEGEPMEQPVKASTIGIIGTGKIGRTLATLLRGFGVTLRGYDPYPDAQWAESAGLEYPDRCPPSP